MTLRDFLRAFMFIALLGCAGAAESAVRAWVDGNAADGNIELHLERDGQTSGEPDAYRAVAVPQARWGAHDPGADLGQ
jgi:hypothetical protein